LVGWWAGCTHAAMLEMHVCMRVHVHMGTHVCSGVSVLVCLFMYVPLISGCDETGIQPQMRLPVHGSCAAGCCQVRCGEHPQCA
jgi:hypothetical protein